MREKDSYHKYYEYFQVGEKVKSGGRQMTSADARICLGLTGVNHPLHVDPIYCATRPDVQTPIIAGSQVLGYIDGQFYECVCPGGEVAAIPDGYEKIRFLKPIHMDDVLTVEYEVKATESLDESYGRVTLAGTVYNQEQVPMTFVLEHFRVEKEGVK